MAELTIVLDIPNAVPANVDPNELAEAIVEAYEQHPQCEFDITVDSADWNR